MNNILIPTDFSNNAYSALYYITRLYEVQSCTFYLLNIYDENTPLKSSGVGKDLLIQLEEESNEGLQNAFHRIQLDDVAPHHNFETISKKGELVDTINHQVKENDIDLVVMGNKGSSEVKAILFGSNTLRAISGVKKCPILTVPKEIDFKPPKEIAFITDYRQVFDAGLLHPLKSMAKLHGSKIRIMHINEEKKLTRGQEINKRILMEYLSPFNCTEHWMPLYKSKAAVIEDFLKELDIDFFAMVNFERGLFEKMTREPVLKRVAFDQDIPLLVLPYLN